VNALLAILNVFFNPAETVRRIRGNTLGWFAPILLGGLIFAAYNHTLPRAEMQAMRNQPPAGVDQAKLDSLVGAMQTTSRFSTLTAPLFFAVMTMLGSTLIFAMCIFLQVNVRFPDVYNLMAHVGLINAMQTLWHLYILLEKGTSVTMTDLSPAFGLQGYLAPGTPKYLYALAAYFSIFAVWHIVMLTVGFAALGRVNLLRAFVVTAPSWFFSLLFFIVVTMARQ
jgi:hypothetical protein